MEHAAVSRQQDHVDRDRSPRRRAGHSSRPRAESVQAAGGGHSQGGWHGRSRRPRDPGAADRTTVSRRADRDGTSTIGYLATTSKASAITALMARCPLNRATDPPGHARAAQNTAARSPPTRPGIGDRGVRCFASESAMRRHQRTCVSPRCAWLCQVGAGIPAGTLTPRMAVPIGLGGAGPWSVFACDAKQYRGGYLRGGARCVRRYWFWDRTSAV